MDSKVAKVLKAIGEGMLCVLFPRYLGEKLGMPEVSLTHTNPPPASKPPKYYGQESMVDPNRSEYERVEE